MSSSQSGHSTENSLLAALRDGTRGEHSLLERHPLLQPLTSDQLILHDYLKVLRALFAFYRQLEPKLEGVLPVDCQIQGYCYLSRSALLATDLERLTGHRRFLDSGRLPALPLPDLATVDRVIGVLYVLEGATQGGRVIAPRVIPLLAGVNVSRDQLPRDKLALDGLDGVQYFHLFRHDQWVRFQRVIAQVSQGPHSADDAVAAAIATFCCLGRYLDYYLTTQAN